MSEYNDPKSEEYLGSVTGEIKKSGTSMKPERGNWLNGNGSMCSIMLMRKRK